MSLAVARPDRAFAPRRLRAAAPGDRYIVALMLLLAGYAVFGKGFAYIAVPPLYIGDVCLMAGLVMLLRTRRYAILLANVPALLLAALMILTACHAVLDLRVYGLMAVRDSVVVLYGLFAFVVIALLLERPERLTLVLGAYSRFAWWYGISGACLVYLDTVPARYMPVWPNSGIPLFYVRLGEGAVHLAGAAVFALLGLRRVGIRWALVMMVSIGMIAVSRGAMVASIVPIVVAAALSRRRLSFLYVFLVALTLFVAAYGAGLNIRLGNGRILGPAQIVDDIESIVSTNEEANLNGTKEWRLAWWKSIVGYTFDGPYFWSGKGFGMNLSQTDGFVVGADSGGEPPRSPHSVHMTMLARLGVPGFVLWLGLLASWFAMLLRSIMLARRRGEHHWADVLIWITCYGAAAVLDASFDVAIEGPMIGIPFWSIFGLGIAACMIYRTQREQHPAAGLVLPTARRSPTST